MAGPYEQNYFALNRFRQLLVRADVRPARYHNVNGTLMPRQVADTLGYGVHRTGWSVCVDHISRCNLPILIDDFIERTFMGRQATQVHRRKFVGIFHYPPDFDLPSFAPKKSDIRQSEIFATSAWKQSQKNLVAGICLSEFLAADLRKRIDVPFHTLVHPTEIDVETWDITAFLDKPTIMQVGAFYRDTRSIARLEAAGLRKIRLLDLRYDWINQWDKLVGQALGPHTLTGEIIHINRVDNTLYDQLFGSSIIHTHYLAASASNVIVEAIARNAPCIVNRHPAVIEYFGPDYPLYQEDLSGPRDIIDRAKAAHHYLKAIDKYAFSFEAFRSGLSAILK